MDNVYEQKVYGSRNVNINKDRKKIFNFFRSGEM